MSSTLATLSCDVPAGRGGTVALHRFACALALCTLALIMLGSMVTTTGSGLAVPDWPTTYGQNMFTFPPSKWVGGIYYEHLHRLVAAGVGLLTVGLCLWLWLSPSSRRLKWLGTAAVILVCGQGLLGGLTVKYLLPTWISVAHAGTAELFLCCMVTLAVATAPRWQLAANPPARRPALRTLAGVVVLCVYLQILLGAWMRHTGSGLAVPDFPLTYGKVLPPLSASAVDDINRQRVWEPLALPPTTLAQIWIHTAHRLGAIVVAIAVLWITRRVLRQWGDQRRVVIPAVLLAALLVLQVMLGPLALWSQRGLLLTTAHVGSGALMLAISWILFLQAGRVPAAEAPPSWRT